MKEITRRLWVIAHRGGAALAAENTMAAFRASTEAGADMLELDVRLTADNHLVIYHDQELTRTAGISKRVVDCSLRELQLLDVGSYFNEGLAGERVPTLPEVLDWARGRARLLLDLKLEPQHEAQIIKEIVARRMEFDVVLGTRSLESLRAMKSLCPLIRTVSLARSLWATQDMVDERVEFVRLWHEWVTPEHVQRFHDMGLPVWVMTGGRHSPDVGETTMEELRELRAAAVDGVILNDPTLAIEANRELLGITEPIIDGSLSV